MSGNESLRWPQNAEKKNARLNLIFPRTDEPGMEEKNSSKKSRNMSKNSGIDETSD